MPGLRLLLTQPLAHQPQLVPFPMHHVNGPHTVIDASVALRNTPLEALWNPGEHMHLQGSEC